MGTPGHMAHPFDVERVQTGQDLIDYINDAVVRLQNQEIGGSVKWDGINTSFKLVTTPDGSKDFRMDRGTSEISSVIGMTTADAFKKWPEGHGMPPAIKKLLTIFNTALPSIESELKELGMWDDSTKYFNTEYIEGKSNVQEYEANILAIHGINQFYEKKAQAHRIRKGTSMDRPGMPRPIDPVTNKPIKGGGIEIPYDHEALASLIKKVHPIAQKYGFEIYGDVPVEFDPESELNLEEVLDKPVAIQIAPGTIKTASLREWLQSVAHPKDKKIKKIVRDKNGAPIGKKEVGALSKDIYLAVLRSAEAGGIPLSDYLDSPNDIGSAIDGGIFYHATRLLGQEVKNALTSAAGSVGKHEGVVLRGMEDFLVKLTGDFIVQGLASTHGAHVQENLSNFTIQVSKDKQVTKTISEWLEEIKNANHTYQKPPQLVYKDILAGTPIVEIVSQENAEKTIYNAVITYVNNLREHIEDEGEDPVTDEEFTGRTIALVPGSMKPPTVGHVGMIKRYSELVATRPNGKVYVFVSKPTAVDDEGRVVSARGFAGREQGISQDEAVELLKSMLPKDILAPIGNVEIKKTGHASPMSPVYDFVSPKNIKDTEQAHAGDVIILGSSTKDEDSDRWNNIIDNQDKRVRPGVIVKNMPVDPITHTSSEHGLSYLKYLNSVEGEEILNSLPTLLKARKKNPDLDIEDIDLETISASDARYLMGFLHKDASGAQQAAARRLIKAFLGDESEEILKSIGYEFEEPEELAETSTAGAVGGFAGNIGTVERPMPGKRGKKRKKQQEIIDTSLIDDVMRLIMERGILR